MEQILGKKLAPKYTDVSKKNRECSMYGFLIDEDLQKLDQSKKNLENFCKQL